YSADLDLVQIKNANTSFRSPERLDFSFHIDLLFPKAVEIVAVARPQNLRMRRECREAPVGGFLEIKNDVAGRLHAVHGPARNRTVKSKRLSQPLRVKRARLVCRLQGAAVKRIVVVGRRCWL